MKKTWSFITFLFINILLSSNILLANETTEKEWDKCIRLKSKLFFIDDAKKECHQLRGSLSNILHPYFDNCYNLVSTQSVYHTGIAVDFCLDLDI